MKGRIGMAMVLLWVSVAMMAADYTYVRDVVYRNQPQDEYVSKMCRLDIAYQQGAKDAPVVVWFHGGGLVGGKKEIPQRLLSDGLVVVGVEYRFLPHVQTEEIIDDAAAAVAWVFDHIKEYGGSTQKIYIAGHSAGGYLVDMVGLDKRRLAKYGKDADQLAGIIPFSGQVLTHYETRHLKGIGPLQPIIDEHAPLTYVRPDCPPILIISGDREMELYGRYEEQAYFWRLFQLNKHPDATLYEMQGFDHGAMCEPGFPLMLRFIREWEKKANK